MPPNQSPVVQPVVQLRLVVEAEDFDQAVAFYRDVLGLAEQAAFSGDGDARVVILQAGRATLELANPAQREMIDAVEVGRPVSPKIRIAFEVVDAIGMTAALVDGGATLIAAPTATPWRSLNSRLEAPAGLQITLFQELPKSTTGEPPLESVRRLGTGDREVARDLFVLMAEVFGEPTTPLSDIYLTALLSRADFWVVASFVDGRPVGGLTAHELPMTNVERAEIFIYDIAVEEAHQRHGLGRGMVELLLEGAAARGIDTVLVPADDDDVHALDFYRALGGSPSAVTIFDFDTGRSESHRGAEGRDLSAHPRPVG